MKVIDLLSKVTTGELKEDVMFEYSCNDIMEYWTLDKFFEEFPVDKDTLNYEVEVEEKDKKIENIGTIYFNENPTEAILHKKIEEIIDYINKENKQ